MAGYIRPMLSERSSVLIIFKFRPQMAHIKKVHQNQRKKINLSFSSVSLLRSNHGKLDCLSLHRPARPPDLLLRGRAAFSSSSASAPPSIWRTRGRTTTYPIAFWCLLKKCVSNASIRECVLVNLWYKCNFFVKNIIIYLTLILISAMHNLHTIFFNPHKALRSK